MAADVTRVVLAPGELYFGQAPAIVHTLLGSCVAITLWHARRRIGGMCHYLLSRRDRYQRNAHQPLGYYACDAVAYFKEQALSHGLKPADFEVKLFGGGSMLEVPEGTPRSINVPSNNIEHGQSLLEANGFKIKVADVGGARYRKIYFDLSTGDVWVQYGGAAQC